MPSTSTNSMNAAHASGDEAHQLLGASLAGNNTAPPTNPSVPAVATQGLANIFVQSYPDQPPPAFQQAATVDSCTGQQTTDLPATNNQRVTTDAHAQAVCTTMTTRPRRHATTTRRRRRTHQTDHGGQGGRGGRGGRGQGGCGRGGRSADNDVPSDLPSDVEEEMRAEEQMLVPLEDQITADTCSVIHSRVSDRSCGNYASYNARLILWMFDDNANCHVIHQNLMPKLLEPHAADTTSLTSDAHPTKLRSSIRSVIKACLENIDGADPATHPLYLDQLSMELMTKYFYTFKKAYHRANVGGEEVIRPGAGDDDQETIFVRLHPLSYDGVTSALSCLFTDCKIARDVNETVKHMWETIPLYKKGSGRKGAKERQSIGLRQTEGKDPMPFAAFLYLAEVLCKSKDPELITAHLFLIIDLNRFSR